MIDVQRDELLSLSQLARRLPNQVNPATVFRWVVRGVKGHKLEVVRTEGTFRLWLISEAWEHQGIKSYEAWSANRISRGVYFVPGGVKDDEQAPLIVRGRIRVVRHPVWRSVPAWTEVRLEDAEQILPRRPADE